MEDRLPLTDLLTSVGLDAEAADLFPKWDEADAVLPEGKLPFLAPEKLWASGIEAGFPESLTDAIVRLGTEIAGRDPLRRLLWYMHHYLFHHDTHQGSVVSNWPVLTAALGDMAPLLPIVVILSGREHMRAKHDARQITDAKIIQDTLRDIYVWAMDYHTRHGRWGMNYGNINWLMHHFRGELYHLVRLHFKHETFTGRIKVFRHQASGQVIALSQGGITYRRDGQMNGAGGVTDETGCWKSVLTESDTEVTGHPIHPRGFARRETITLDLRSWRLVLEPGDPIIGVHIPASGPMDHALCGQSFELAVRFFPKYFPERSYKAFASSSWLFDPQLEMIFPPTSNLVRFLQEFYVYPIRTNGNQLYERVFGDVKDINNLPRSTSLQRAVANFLEAGGHWRSGGVFLFPEDLDWGEQVYRKQDALPPS